MESFPHRLRRRRKEYPQRVCIWRHGILAAHDRHDAPLERKAHSCPTRAGRLASTSVRLATGSTTPTACASSAGSIISSTSTTTTGRRSTRRPGASTPRPTWCTGATRACRCSPPSPRTVTVSLAAPPSWSAGRHPTVATRCACTTPATWSRRCSDTAPRTSITSTRAASRTPSPGPAGCTCRCVSGKRGSAEPAPADRRQTKGLSVYPAWKVPESV